MTVKCIACPVPCSPKKAEKPTEICTNWEYYRAKTGHCETCGLSMRTHPTCAWCGILAGDGHLEYSLKKYRGRSLCNLCIQSWEWREEWLGCELSFGQVTTTFASFTDNRAHLTRQRTQKQK